jgi:hypothetical protein
MVEGKQRKRGPAWPAQDSPAELLTFSLKAVVLRAATPFSTFIKAGQAHGCLQPRQGSGRRHFGANGFFGEGCLAAQPLRTAGAAAMSERSIVRLEKPGVVRLRHDEPAFSELFLHYLLSRNIRIEEDLYPTDHRSRR